MVMSGGAIDSGLLQNLRGRHFLDSPCLEMEVLNLHGKALVLAAWQFSRFASQERQALHVITYAYLEMHRRAKAEHPKLP